MSVTIRRIAVGDGALLRDLRLRALSDAPWAFGSTFDDEAQRTIDIWEALALRRSTGDNEATFIAEVDGDAVALVGVYRNPQERRDFNLASMWVSPPMRRTGFASRLVQHALNWARSGGGHRVSLWVTIGNEPAEQLYARLGFAPTDEEQPLPSDEARQERRMVFLIR